MNSESLSVFILFGLVLLLGLVYVVRGYLNGDFKHYERVDRQGGSVLLGKAVMNFAVWGMEPVARLLARLSITPNQVTLSSVFFGLVAGLCIASGHFGYAFCVAIVAGMTDMLDGMLARLSGKSDASGVVLDSTIDRYVDFFLLAGCALYFRHDVMSLSASLLAIHGSFMISYTTAKAEAMAVRVPRGAMKRTERYVYLLLALVASTFYPGSEGLSPLLVVVWLLAVLTNWTALMRFRSLFLSAGNVG